MPGEQRLAPTGNLRNELVQEEQGRDPPQREDSDGQHNEAPRRDSQRGPVELVEREPGADVNERSAVQNEVDHGREHLVLDLRVEVAVPGDRAPCGSDPDTKR